MAHSNVTGATPTMLSTKLDTFKIKLSLPDPHHQKSKKKIEISVDGKVEWTHKWTKPASETFAPPFEGRDLSIPLSSTMQISLFSKHWIHDHLLGSCSGRVIDFVINKEKPLTLQDCGYGA
ncbi:hypothetical protein PAXRUDRAFT_834122, partial [Paxillus rubicundulus Ve08.2h10]